MTIREQVVQEVMAALGVAGAPCTPERDRVNPERPETLKAVVVKWLTEDVAEADRGAVSRKLIIEVDAGVRGTSTDVDPVYSWVVQSVGSLEETSELIQRVDEVGSELTVDDVESQLAGVKIRFSCEFYTARGNPEVSA